MIPWQGQQHQQTLTSLAKKKRLINYAYMGKQCGMELFKNVSVGALGWFGQLGGRAQVLILRSVSSGPRRALC